MFKIIAVQADGKVKEIKSIRDKLREMEDKQDNWISEIGKQFIKR